MITRRRFLASTGGAALGLALPPLGSRNPPTSGRLRPMLHPLFREPIADPASIPRFVQPLTVPAEQRMRIDATRGGVLGLRMAETTQDVLGLGIPTPIFGYGRLDGPVTWPGPTVVARSGRPLVVRWHNQLPKPPPAPVDSTAPWAFGGHGQSVAKAGLPGVPPLPGGHVDAGYDGGPDQ